MKSSSDEQPRLLSFFVLHYLNQSKSSLNSHVYWDTLYINKCFAISILNKNLNFVHIISVFNLKNLVLIWVDLNQQISKRFKNCNLTTPPLFWIIFPPKSKTYNRCFYNRVAQPTEISKFSAQKAVIILTFM